MTEKRKNLQFQNILTMTLAIISIAGATYATIFSYSTNINEIAYLKKNQEQFKEDIKELRVMFISQVNLLMERQDKINAKTDDNLRSLDKTIAEMNGVIGKFDEVRAQMLGQNGRFIPVKVDGAK